MHVWTYMYCVMIQVSMAHFEPELKLRLVATLPEMHLRYGSTKSHTLNEQLLDASKASFQKTSNLEKCAQPLGD